MGGKHLVIGAVAAMVGLLPGCQEHGDDGIAVDATGTVAGLMWLDRNGNGSLEGSDAPAANVRVRLLPPVGATPAQTATANAAGEFVLSEVMVGDYRAMVDTESLGDTLRVFRLDDAELTVTAGDTARIVVGVTYPTVSIDSARATTLGRPLFVEGTVLSEWDTFGDGTVHVRDTTGAIRGVRALPSSVALGDSVRLYGITTVQGGQVVLKDAVVFLVETGIESPEAVGVSTAVAQVADNGALDAELVRIDDAIVEDTTRNPSGEPVVHVNDGSGTLSVVLDRDIAFFLIPPESGLVGASIDVVGVLLPSENGAAGVWVLKPRRNPDVVLRAP